MFDLERDGLHQVVPCPWVSMEWNQQADHTKSVTAQVNKDSASCYAAGAPSKICGRDIITIGT